MTSRSLESSFDLNGKLSTSLNSKSVIYSSCGYNVINLMPLLNSEIGVIYVSESNVQTNSNPPFLLIRSSRECVG